MPNGWPHCEYEAKGLKPASDPHFGAALVERQLVRLFSTSTDAEARVQLADWNYRLDWDRVMDLRGLAQAAHDAEDGTYAEMIAANDAYAEALTSLALDARRAAGLHSVPACEADEINGAA